MKSIDYEDIFEIIKENEPISLSGIGKELVKQGRLTKEEFQLSDNCKVAGFISNLSQNGFIEKVVNSKIDTASIRKTKQNYWKTTGKIKV